jgi:hypothetical protein
MGRVLELLCSLVSIDGVDTLLIQEASALRVGTAYEPGIDDEEVKREWLMDNPEFELTENGEIKRKVRKHT